MSPELIEIFKSVPTVETVESPPVWYVDTKFDYPVVAWTIETKTNVLTIYNNLWEGDGDLR